MKYKVVSHPKLVLFTFFVPVPILFIETFFALLALSENGNNYLGIVIFIIIQYIGLWGICFAIYRFAYQVVYLDDEGISTKKKKINWQDIEEIKVKEIKLMEHTIGGAITFDSMVFFFGVNGEKIGISLSQKNIKAISFYAKNCSIVVEDFLKTV